MKTSLHDLHECYSSIVDGIRKERWVSTIATNLPYRLQRSKKQVLESSPNYARGTFFVITDNGKAPELNKHLKKGSLL